MEYDLRIFKPEIDPSIFYTKYPESFIVEEVGKVTKKIHWQGYVVIHCAESTVRTFIKTKLHCSGNAEYKLTPMETTKERHLHYLCKGTEKPKGPPKVLHNGIGISEEAIQEYNQTWIWKKEVGKKIWDNYNGSYSDYDSMLEHVILWYDSKDMLYNEQRIGMYVNTKLIRENKVCGSKFRSNIKQDSYNKGYLFSLEKEEQSQECLKNYIKYKESLLDPKNSYDPKLI